MRSRHTLLLAAIAYLAYRASRVLAAAEGAGGGSDDFFLSIIRAGLEDQTFRPRYRDRMKSLLAEYEGREVQGIRG